MQIKVFLGRSSSAQGGPVQHSSWRRSYGHIWLATGNYCSPRVDNEGFIRRGGQFNYYCYYLDIGTNSNPSSSLLNYTAHERVVP